MPFDSTLSPCSQAFWQIAVAFAALSPAHLAFGQTAKPAELTCNSPITPLGIDVNPPKLSWQLRDERQGARQTAHEVQVASSPSHLEGGKHDVWDSGQVESAQSVDVIYAGIALAPEKRYYWRVLTWDQEEKPYPESDISWWETGWAAPSQWRGQWIGYEKPEHRRMREADAAWITNPGWTTIWVAATRTIDSRYGTIRSSWTIAGGTGRWNVSIPPNAKARMPVALGRAGAFSVDGEPLVRSSKVRMTGTQNGMENYEFPAGSYSLEVALAQP
jgi:Bacterial alpha-L-rhamnosidase C-terminal domain